MKISDKIHPSNLKNELGNILVVKKEQENKYLPEGRYVVYEQDLEMGIKLFKDNEFYLIEEWDEDDEFVVYKRDEEERIDNLIEATFQEILILSNEGWAEKDNNEDFLNLSPIMKKLETYKKIKDIIKSKQ